MDVEFKLLKRKCPKCKGFLRENLEGDYECLNCGYTHRNLVAQHKWIELNKDNIIEDLYQLGKAAALQKWQSSNNTIQYCLQRWGMPTSAALLSIVQPRPTPATPAPATPVPATPAPATPAPATPAPVLPDVCVQDEGFLRAVELPPDLSSPDNRDHYLPPFPPFDAAWDPHVQQTWLCSYIDLIREGVR